MTLDRFVDDSGKTYTLEQLRIKENIAYPVANHLTDKAVMTEKKQIKDFVNGKLSTDKIVAHTLGDSTKQLINAKSNEVLFSKETLKEHLISHPDITAKEYSLIPEILEKGEMYRQKTKRYVLLHKDGKLYRAAIKTTQDESEVYLLSLFSTTEELADIQIRKKFERIR